MRNPGKLHKAGSPRRAAILSRGPALHRTRVAVARVPKQDRELGAEEIAVLKGVAIEIAESFRRMSEVLDFNLQRMDAALKDIAEQKRQTRILLHELGID